MAGYATEISVIINNDGSVTVEDNGRGIPVEVHPDLGFSTLQGVMTRAEVRRQVQEGGLPDLRRPARRGRHGGQLPLRVVRGGSPPQRPRLSAGIRARRAGGRRPPHRPQRPARHQDHLQARRADLSQHDLPVQHPLQAAAGAGLPQPGREDRLQGHAQRRRRDLPLRARHPGVHRVSQPRQRARPRRHHLHQQPGRGRRAGDRLAVLVGIHGERPLLREQHLHQRRRHPPLGLPRRHHADDQRLRQEGGHLQGPGAHRRRLPRGADGRDFAARAGAAVRGADKDQAGQQRDRGDRQFGGGRLFGPLPGGEPQDGPHHRPEGAVGRRGPRERRGRPACWSASARAP